MLSRTIGSSRHLALTVFQRFGLVPFRDVLPPHVFAAAAADAGCAPQRARALTPEVVVWLMMYVALATTSMRQGLLRAWGLVRAACPSLKETCVTEEAFCQARGQLTLGFWQRLWDRFGAAYQQRFKDEMTWNGHRILAVDGSAVELPNVRAVVDFFGRPKGKDCEGKSPQGRLVAMCSAFTGFCVAFKLLSLRFTEHDALRHLILKLRRNDLLLLDRGFFSLPGDLADSLAESRFPGPGFRSGVRIPRADQVSGT
jgi:hypothetical protein